MPQSITLSRLSTLLLAFAAATPGWAAVTAEEAAKLKSELTPLGAERAASKDGAIPAWTSGYTTVSASYKAGTPRPIHSPRTSPCTRSLQRPWPSMPTS